MLRHHVHHTQPRNCRARFQSPEPDIAAAEVASEEGQAMHLDDADDWQRIEELDRQTDDLRAAQERDNALITRHARAINSLATRICERGRQINDLDRESDSLRMLIRGRHPAHIDGHRAVNGILESRQRAGRITILGARERDIDIES